MGRNGQAITFSGIDIFTINPAGKIQTMQAYWNPAVVAAQLMPS
jgi:steroid Delta-isomerase